MAFKKLTAALGSLAADVEKTAAQIRGHAATVSQSLAAIGTAARDVDETSRAGLDAVVSRSRDAAGAVGDAARSISKTLAETRMEARQARDDVASIVEEILETAADQFDDLRDMVKEFSGPFAEDLKLQLDALELAGTTTENLLRLYGDTVIEGKKLSEVLQGADLDKYERDLQKLIGSLRKGSLEVGELLEFLNERGGKFGKAVAQWVQALKSGEITLKRFKDLIEGLQAKFKGSEFETFLDEIEEALEQGLI